MGTTSGKGVLHWLTVFSAADQVSSAELMVLLIPKWFQNTKESIAGPDLV